MHSNVSGPERRLTSPALTVSVIEGSVAKDCIVGDTKRVAIAASNQLNEIATTKCILKCKKAKKHTK